MIPYLIHVPSKASVLLRQHSENATYDMLCHYHRSIVQFGRWSEVTAVSPYEGVADYKCARREYHTASSISLGNLFISFPSAPERISRKCFPRNTDFFALKLPNWTPMREHKLRKSRLLSSTQSTLLFLEQDTFQLVLFFFFFPCFAYAGLRWGKVRASQTVEVVAGPGDLNAAILAQLDPLLQEPYRPFIFLLNKHVETIFAAFLRSNPSIKYRRECLRMKDGGTVALDWPIDGEDPKLWSTEPSEGADVLILLPGLTGGSGDTYVRHLLLRARTLGWNIVVFNSRGCAESPVTTPQFYSASFTEDLGEVVRHVHNCFPNSRLYAVGWSLGANILVRYVGQEGKNCFLAAAVSLCNPFDLVVADEEFRKGFNNVYDCSLAKGLRNILKRHRSLFEEIGGDYNIMKSMNARTVRDFDDGLTRVSFGYNSVDDYYQDASSSRSIGDVKTPLLCIQADNDPIAPSRGIPRSEIQTNPYCLLVVTPTGGHLGWVAGEGAPYGAPWTDSLVMSYLQCLRSIQTIQNNRNPSEEATKTSSHAYNCI